MPSSSSAKFLTFQTTKGPEFIDITDKARGFVREKNLDHGVLIVFSKHTTAAIRISENKSKIIQDLGEFLKALAPEDKYYRHNDFSIRTEHMHEDEAPNAHSHCQSLGLGASETIPIMNGRLQLGDSQKLFLIELDHARERKIIFQLIR